MRILFINHTGTVSGAEHALLQVVEGLGKQCEIVVACPRQGELAQAIDALGADRRTVPAFEASFRLDPVHTPAGLASLGAGTAAVIAMTRRVRPDVLFANTTRAALMAAGARRVERVPLAIRLHDHLPTTRAGTAVRNVIAAHAQDVLAVSRYTAERFNRGLRRPLAHCVYNGIDRSRFDPDKVPAAPLRQEFGLGGTATLLGHVAQITPWKGQADSIRVCHLLRERGLDVHLFLVGAIAFAGKGVRYDNAGYLDALHGLVDDLGVRDAVHFLGARSDVPALLRAFDLSLLPSHEDPAALVVAESLAMGTPAFVSNDGGLAEFLGDGASGRALPPAEPDKWARAIEETVRTDGRLAAMRGETRAAAARFTVEAMTAHTLAHLERLADAGADRPADPAAV